MRDNMMLISGRRLLLMSVIVIAFAAGVAAQAGRRGPTKSRVPAPQPIPSPTEAQSKSQTAARIQLLVAVNEPSGFDRIPLAVPESVLEACVQRLRMANEVMAVAAPRRMTRAEAITAAKAETRYVVWLQVRNERDDYGADASTHSNRLYVNFMVYEPGTAKIKKSGRAQHGARVGNVGVAVPGMGGAVYSDYAIKETAKQAADRILDAFQIRIGGWPR